MTKSSLKFLIDSKLRNKVKPILKKLDTTEGEFIKIAFETLYLDHLRWEIEKSTEKKKNSTISDKNTKKTVKKSKNLNKKLESAANKLKKGKK